MLRNKMSVRFFVRALTVTTITAAVAVGCQATQAGQHGSGDSLSLIADARECGMVVSVGRQAGGAGGYNFDESKPLQLPAMINLVAQSIACGDNGAEAGTQWLAIGMGIERPQIYVVSRGQPPALAQVRLAQDGTVELVDQSGRGLGIGKAIEPDVSMPVALQPGTKVEIRFQGRAVGAKEAKTLGMANLEIWLIPAGV